MSPLYLLAALSVLVVLAAARPASDAVPYKCAYSVVLDTQCEDLSGCPLLEDCKIYRTEETMESGNRIVKAHLLCSISKQKTQNAKIKQPELVV